MDWESLKIVLAVARSGSLSAAARALDTTQPTISRRLDSFERAIGVRLFERGNDGLLPTPLAQGLIHGLAQMEDGALAVERRIASRGTELEGPLLVTSLDWLGDHVIAPITAQFAARHPRVEVTLINDARTFNVARREADIAFRFESFQQENLISRRVAHVAYGLYAAPTYLDRHGIPDFDTGCREHAIVLLHDDAGEVCYRDWLKELASNAEVLMRSNGIQSHFAAVEAGEAIAVLPRVAADGRSTLCRIAPPCAEPVQSVRVGFHADMRDTPRLRAFIDFAVSELSRHAAALNPGGRGLPRGP